MGPGGTDTLGGGAVADTMHVHAYAREFAADRTAPRAVASWLRSLIAAGDLTERALADAELCLDELVTNVLRCAWDDPSGRALSVRVTRTDAELTVTVEDDGRPFDPREAPVPEPARSLEEAIPGGRGLMLVRSIASRVEYERRDGRNRVTVVFLLRPER